MNLPRRPTAVLLVPFLASLAVGCAPEPAGPTPPTIPDATVRRASVAEVCTWTRVDAATNVATTLQTTRPSRTVAVTAPGTVTAGTAFDVVISEADRDVPHDAVPEAISAATSYTAYDLSGPLVLEDAASYDGGQVYEYPARQAAVVVTPWPGAGRQRARTNSLRIVAPKGTTGTVPLRLLPDPAPSEISSAFSIITKLAGYSGACHLSGPVDLGTVKVVSSASAPA